MNAEHGFYVDLDVLFDTRHAVLSAMDEIKADDLFMQGYHRRERDEFPGFDIQEFRKRYKERDKFLLATAKPTGVLMNLSTTINHYASKSLIDGSPGTVTLFVNIYPYVLNDEEINDVVLCIKHLTLNQAGVRVINKNPLEITPAWLKDNVNIFYLYHWNQWLNHQIHNLVKLRLDDTLIVTPRLAELTQEEGRLQVEKIKEEFKDDTDTSKYLEVEKGRDHYEMISEWTRMFVGIEFHEVRDFSVYLPDEIEAPEGKFETDEGVFEHCVEVDS